MFANPGKILAIDGSQTCHKLSCRIVDVGITICFFIAAGDWAAAPRLVPAIGRPLVLADVFLGSTVPRLDPDPIVGCAKCVVLPRVCLRVASRFAYRFVNVKRVGQESQCPESEC